MALTGVRSNFSSRFGASTATFAGIVASLLINGCAASAPRRSGDTPLPVSRFPAMPVATGPIAIRVVYPPQNAVISTNADSTFIFGSVGNGAARLAINSSAVTVHPNGSFLAFLPVPRDSMRYAIEATLDGRTERLEHEVRVAARAPQISNDGPLVGDQQTVRPAVQGRWSRGERITVSVRTNANAAAWLVSADSTRIPLLTARETLGDSTLWQTSVDVAELTAGARVVVARGSDSVSLAVPPQTLLDSLGGTLPLVRLVGSSAVPDTDRVVIARPVPNGTYKWLLLPGTIVEVTARVANQVRVRLDSGLEAWVDSAAVAELEQGAMLPRRVVGNPRVIARGDSDWADVVLPMSAPAPYSIDQIPGALVVTLHGATVDIDIAALRSDSTVVRNITWSQLARDRGQITIHLATEPFGYLMRWQPGAMVLRVRRPPAIDPRRPLAGLTIAVDPGHPPVGATGPTGLYEGDAVLPIGEKLRDELVRRGASVVMTRTTREPVALAERPVIARRASAHAFVSIHLNALPDGVNPFNLHGTGTYFFHPQSMPLARAVQAGMVQRLGLRDLGVYYDNLAVVRQTWMPSILCEGAFIIIPEQEAWLRTPEFQTAYALGVADGLEAYFRGVATR